MSQFFKKNIKQISNLLKNKNVMLKKREDIPEALMKLIVDCDTPRNAKLTAKYKRSFAYPSMKDRVPIIITRIVDYLSRDKTTITKCYGECALKEIKEATGELSQLKNQLQTAKKFEYFTSEDNDTDVWNEHLKYLEENGDEFNYFETDWLFAECYLYRRIREIFATKCLLKTLDPFSAQKTILLQNSLPVMVNLFKHLNENRIFDSECVMAYSELQKEFFKLVKLSLWANRFDLSLRVDIGELGSDTLELINTWDENILVDDSPKLLSTLSYSDNTEKIVNIITDNSGLEIICDLCLAEMLVTRFHVKRINFRVKPIPWYVSDVIKRDLLHTVQSIACHPNEYYQYFGRRWQKYLDTGVWRIISDQYWCLGKGYSEMVEEDPELYSELQCSSLIILKGDLNYRKLLLDINWEPSTPFYKAIRNFHPAPLLALRTCKADVICGLKPGQAEELFKKHPKWQITGEFAVIQFDSPT